MAVLAKGLPVFFIPEKPHVTPVWRDVVHHRRGGQFTTAHALHTQRMLTKIGPSSLLPAAIIAP